MEGGTRVKGEEGEWRIERESSFQVLPKGKEKKDFIY